MFETSLLFNDPPKEKKSFWLNPKIKTLGVCALIISGIACTGWGTWLFFNGSSEAEQIPENELLFLEPPKESLVYIDVSGAVENPGIYSLKEGSRVAAAIEAAGGVSLLADSKYIHTSLNLSSRLKDEQKIYIPFEGEQKVSVAETDSVSANNTFNNNSLISINDASESQLDELPRIGPATAEKIIGGRPYASIDELITKNIVSEGVFTEIKALIKI